MYQKEARLAESVCNSCFYDPAGKLAIAEDKALEKMGKIVFKILTD